MEILEDHDHFTIIENLSNPEFSLVQKILKFIQSQ